ncbi:MAG TPA: PAS domain-containing protein, partial [Puia sp.]|nr:PAS domain-containing protein [Puia sp.]
MDSPTRKRLEFTILPAYAHFLLENKLEELSVLQMSLFKEIKPPLFRYFENKSDEELISLGAIGLRKLLGALADGKSVEYIENSLRDWLNNQLPQISRNQLEAEDITMISLIRRRVFRKYIDEYASDFQTAVQVLTELDDFTTISETISLKLLLKLQQDLYEQNQKLAKIGNWVWDLKKNIFSWSRELYHIYEIENVDVNRIDLASYNHPDDDPIVKNHMEVSRKNKTAHDFFYRIILPDGKEKTLHAMGEVMTDSNGEAEMMFGTLQDFTGQKQIQKALEDNQFFIQKITDLTPSMIAVYNIQTGKYLFINRAIESLLGYKKEQVLEEGMNFFLDIIHPEDLVRVQSENSRALEIANQEGSVKNEQIIEFSYRLRHANGAYRWFNTYGSVFERDKSGKVEKLINVSIDVTDQLNADSKLKEKDRELMEQEERYFRMINEVEDYAILRLSPEGIIENWNTGAEKIKGYKAREIIGKHFRIFYSPEDQNTHLPESLIRKASQEGKALHEGWRVRKDKSRFWGSILITALHDNSGRVVGFSKVTRDLTQMKIASDNLKEYNERILKTNAELEEKNSQLESFNYIASHDLKEPLRKIRLFISRLKDETDLKPRVRETLSKIEISSVRMQDLIEGLLLYCQADLNSIKENINLDTLLNDVISDFSDLIDQKEMEITKMKLPSVNMNPIQFRQVFYNLISNAVKYKKENTTLKLNISYRMESMLNGNNNIPHLYHKISFDDNGIGFEPDHTEKIFGLFQRLHDQSKYSGTGLGLAICKKVIENHGGKISAEGVAGKGARFDIF